MSSEIDTFIATMFYSLQTGFHRVMKEIGDLLVVDEYIAVTRFLQALKQVELVLG